MGQQADGTGPGRGASPPPAGLSSAWVMAFAAAGAAAVGLAGALRGRRSTKPAAAQEASVAKAEMDEPVTDENGRQGGGEPEAEAHAESSDDVYDASAEGEDEQEEEPLVNDASPPAEEEEPDAGPDPAPAEEDDPEPAHA